MRSAARVIAIWLAGLGAAAQFARVSVSYADLGRVYPGHGDVGIGVLVSVVGLVGLIFGTTAGLAVSRIGPRRVMLAALAAGAVLSAIEALLPPWPVMIAARIVEGISHLAIVVVGPAAIAAAASPRRQGLAMTLWATFFALTYAVLALIAPPILASGGIAALFLGHAAWMAGCLVLLAVLMPKDPPPPSTVTRTGGVLADHLAIYASPVLAGPATGFVFYALIYVATLTLLPPAFPPDLRGFVAAGMPLVSIATSLALGLWVLGRVPAVRMVRAGFALGATAMAGLGLAWSLPTVAAGFALLMAAAMGIVQGASFAAIPELMREPADRARASGAVAQLGNLGTTAGTPVLAALTASLGPAAFVVYALPLCAAGIAMAAWQAARRARI